MKWIPKDNRGMGDKAGREVFQRLAGFCFRLLSCSRPCDGRCEGLLLPIAAAGLQAWIFSLLDPQVSFHTLLFSAHPFAGRSLLGAGMQVHHALNLCLM